MYNPSEGDTTTVLPQTEAKVHKPRQRRLSWHDEAEVMRRVERGDTIAEIARSFRISPSSISRCVKKLFPANDYATVIAKAASGRMVDSAIKAAKIAEKKGRVDPHKLVLQVAGVLEIEKTGGIMVNVGVSLPGLPAPDAAAFAPVGDTTTRNLPDILSESPVSDKVSSVYLDKSSPTNELA